MRQEEVVVMRKMLILWWRYCTWPPWWEIKGIRGEASSDFGGQWLSTESGKKGKKTRKPPREEWRSKNNVKDCLLEQRSKVGKECNIGLRSEEMRRKKITTQQQGFLIQFSLLLCSVIWSVAKQSKGVVPPACDCWELKACLNLSLC